MPPDPVLGLLAFVGLFVYACVGGIVGSLAMRVFDWNLSTSSYNGLIRGLAGRHQGNQDAWIGFTFMALLWPATLTLGVIIAMCVGPALVARNVGRYVAKAQLGES